MKQSSFVIIFIIGFVSIIVGCQPRAMTNQNIATPVLSATGFPGEQQGSQNITIHSTDDSLSTPTLIAGTGYLEAVIQMKGNPVSGANFYLADILNNQTGQEIAVTTDRETAPHAISSIDGRITFPNVKPGRYALVLYDGFNIYLLLYPETGLGILVDVEQENLNLGVIDFPDLPLD